MCVCVCVCVRVCFGVNVLLLYFTTLPILTVLSLFGEVPPCTEFGLDRKSALMPIDKEACVLVIDGTDL